MREESFSLQNPSQRGLWWLLLQFLQWQKNKCALPFQRQGVFPRGLLLLTPWRRYTSLITLSQRCVALPDKLAPAGGEVVPSPNKATIPSPVSSSS